MARTGVPFGVRLPFMAFASPCGFAFLIWCARVAVWTFLTRQGVDVRSGTRYSAVFWFSDSEDSCRNRVSPWYERPLIAHNELNKPLLMRTHY